MALADIDQETNATLVPSSLYRSTLKKLFILPVQSVVSLAFFSSRPPKSVIQSYPNWHGVPIRNR